MVARLEQEQPELFTAVRNAAYLAYYESPAVIPAIQALGQPYRATSSAAIRRSRSIPSADRPRHNRGSYIPTDEVRPVDLSGLDHLGGSDERA